MMAGQPEAAGLGKGVHSAVPQTGQQTGAAVADARTGPAATPCEAAPGALASAETLTCSQHAGSTQAPGGLLGLPQSRQPHQLNGQVGPHAVLASEHLQEAAVQAPGPQAPQLSPLAPEDSSAGLEALFAGRQVAASTPPAQPRPRAGEIQDTAADPAAWPWTPKTILLIDHHLWNRMHADTLARDAATPSADAAPASACAAPGGTAASTSGAALDRGGIGGSTGAPDGPQGVQLGQPPPRQPSRGLEAGLPVVVGSVEHAAQRSGPAEHPVPCTQLGSPLAPASATPGFLAPRAGQLAHALADPAPSTLSSHAGPALLPSPACLRQSACMAGRLVQPSDPHAAAAALQGHQPLPRVPNLLPCSALEQQHSSVCPSAAAGVHQGVSPGSSVQPGSLPGPVCAEVPAHSAAATQLPASTLCHPPATRPAVLALLEAPHSATALTVPAADALRWAPGAAPRATPQPGALASTVAGDTGSARLLQAPQRSRLAPLAVTASQLPAAASAATLELLQGAVEQAELSSAARSSQSPPLTVQTREGGGRAGGEGGAGVSSAEAGAPSALQAGVRRGKRKRVASARATDALDAVKAACPPAGSAEAGAVPSAQMGCKRSELGAPQCPAAGLEAPGLPQSPHTGAPAESAPVDALSAHPDSAATQPAARSQLAHASAGTADSQQPKDRAASRGGPLASEHQPCDTVHVPLPKPDKAVHTDRAQASRGQDTPQASHCREQGAKRVSRPPKRLQQDSEGAALGSQLGVSTKHGSGGEHKPAHTPDSAGRRAGSSGGAAAACGLPTRSESVVKRRSGGGQALGVCPAPARKRCRPLVPGDGACKGAPGYGRTSGAAARGKQLARPKGDGRGKEAAAAAATPGSARTGARDLDLQRVHAIRRPCGRTATPASACAVDVPVLRGRAART